MQKKFNIRKGDTVLVLSGEYKGQQGKILKMETKTDKALVEGINLVSKHTKPNAKNPQGGIIKKEAPIHVSNLMLVDPATGKPTRVGKKRTETGKLVRYSKKTGEEIK
ncbi:MAG: 50S ribosomal protein L24 [Bacteroidales bacterium]|nr:50S ribosomal protein L24 [Bacteroidales bacterium]